MLDSYLNAGLETIHSYIIVISLLTQWLFTDFRWAWMLLIALAFDVLVTLPVTLFIHRRLERHDRRNA